MTNLTDYEGKVLNAIAYHEMNPSNGMRPETASDVGTWGWTDDFAADAGITIPQAKGVLSSLVKKGLVKVLQYDVNETVVSFTVEGYAAWETVDDGRAVQ
jgi:DNA-binding MarR family transcriptional regulator